MSEKEKTKEIRIQIKKICPKCKQGMVFARLENSEREILERILFCLNCGYSEPIEVEIVKL